MVKRPSTDPMRGEGGQAMISRLKKSISISSLLWFSLLRLSFPAFAGEPPQNGAHFPEFSLQSPESDADRNYLGIGNSQTFALRELHCSLTLVEILGVYCPQCHAQAPLFNKLFSMIQGDQVLSKNIKMLGVAIGATPFEVEYLRNQFEISFPVLSDPKFEIHKSLGEPRTPLTLIVSSDGRICFAHLGVIKDIEKMFLDLKDLLR